MVRSLFLSQYLPNRRPHLFGFTTYNFEMLTRLKVISKKSHLLTVFAIFLSPWYSLFSSTSLPFTSNCLNFHSMICGSPMLIPARDFEFSALKMFIKPVLNDTRSWGEHRFRGAPGDDLFWLALPVQLGRPCWVCVFWIGLPCALTHQHPLFSRHWIGAYVPSSRHFGTNFIFGRCERAYERDERHASMGDWKR